MNIINTINRNMVWWEQILQGLANIADGIIKIISLGFFTSAFALEASRYFSVKRWEREKEQLMGAPTVVLNQIRTPDGTILKSMHVHDYVTHMDANGLEYMNDGGIEYMHRNVHRTKRTIIDRLTNWLEKILLGYTWVDPLAYEEISIYSNAPWEILRTAIHRGGRGTDGKQPLKWVPLCEMSNSWIDAVIEYEGDRGNDFINSQYEKELEYRKENDIFIEEDGTGEKIKK